MRNKLLNKQSDLHIRGDDFFKALWPCLSGEVISSRPEIKPQCDELESLISAPVELYIALYETTLWRFMEFCQAMPQDILQPHPYSLLNTALSTAINALKLRRGAMLPRHSNSETIAEQEPLWTYALFTASLWANWPNMQTDRTISLYKSEQEFLGFWHPVAGCLYEPKMFYKILLQPHSANIDNVVCLASALGKIIPSVGLRWLTSELKVWSNWWEMITQTAGERNELKSLIKVALGASAQSTVSSMSSSLQAHREAQHCSELPLNETISEPATLEACVSADNHLVLESKSSIIEVDESLQQQALADLNQWILKQCFAGGAGNNKKWFVRIHSGVLIRFSALSEFIKEYNRYDSPESLLTALAPYLRKEDNQFIVRYHFVYYQGEEVVRGIILLKKFLCQILETLPAENQFIRNVSFTVNSEEV